MRLIWRSVQIDGGPWITTSLTQAEANALREYATNQVVLEIGSGFGYSSILMAHTAKHVFAVDPHAGEVHKSFSTMRDNLRKYGFEDKVSIILGSSEDVLPALAASGARFGLIFIDGAHDTESVSRDLSWAIHLLDTKGVVACHDYGEETCPGVKEALDQFPGHPERIIDTLWVF